MFADFAVLLPHLFPILGFLTSAIFMVIIVIILVRALSKTDVSALFTSQDEAGGISLTKFWQNVAYAAATISFMAVNINGALTGASLEMLWVIYLGIVASNAVLSKWISMKYSRTEETTTKTASYRQAQYDAPPVMERTTRVRPARPAVDDPDA